MGGFVETVEEEKPTKKKGSKKRKKTSQEEPLPEVKFTPRPASRVSGTGIALANERVYVFARLHQMIYSRLLEAKGLCEAEKDRQDRLAAEPHQVLEAISADADGEMARLRSRGYAGFLELVAMLLCGDVNKSTYDDACRLLVGTEAFRVRALDKMCRAAVEAMRSLAA